MVAFEWCSRSATITRASPKTNKQMLINKKQFRESNGILTAIPENWKEDELVCAHCGGRGFIEDGAYDDFQIKKCVCQLDEKANNN